MNSADKEILSAVGSILIVLVIGITVIAILQ